MKRAFVIGHPIGHSRSPLIHGHWIDKYGVAGSYEPFDVSPEALPDFVDRIRTGEFVGGNVTVPHKQDAFRLVDRRDPETAPLGAFNTLVAQSGPDGTRIHGSNTDFYGFLANLDQEAPGWTDHAANAIVLGAGGAARAIVAALASRGLKVRVLNRTVSRATQLVASLGDDGLSAHTMSDFAALAPDTQVLVNTTTIGMHGTRFDDLPLDDLPKTALVTDIVYVPIVTPLLADAQALGLKTVDGLGMLLHQAVPGFEAWFGTRPEVTPELRALIEETL